MWKKCLKWAALLLLLVILAAAVWNYNYGYSLTHIKHILSGEYIYDADYGGFIYFGEVYFPRNLVDGKFFQAADASSMLRERGEPVLYKYQPAENEVVFRFCAFGYMEQERVYRIHINEVEKSGYVIYDGNTRIDLDAQQCGEIFAIFSDESFWNQPFKNHLIYPALTIIMEGKRGDQYHVIKRYSPNDEDIMDNDFRDDWDDWYHTGLTEFESMFGGIAKQNE